MTREVRVYRSSRGRETYLYVDSAEDLARVPGPLLDRFGTPVLVLTLELPPERKLARVAATTVLDAIATIGFYLQMPPPLDAPQLPEELLE
jgi:uncharacterized protein YcgL (UPF0745 family)